MKTRDINPTRKTLSNTVTIFLLFLFLSLTLSATTPVQALLTTQPPQNIIWQTEDLDYWVRSVAWSPGGDKLAVGGNFQKVIVYDSSGNMLWQSEDLGAEVYSVAWSPGGDKLAAGVGTRVIVYDSSGNMLWQKDLGYWIVRSVAWSPQGDKLAAGGDFNKVMIFDSSGNMLWQTPDLGADVRSVSWSPSSDKLAVGIGDCCYGRVIVYDSNGNQLWQTEDLSDWVMSVAWSPSGDKLAVGGNFNRVIVFDSSGNMLWQSEDLGDDVFSVSWGSQGDKLAAGGWFQKVIVYDANGSLLWQTEDLGSYVESVAWSPQGDKLAVGLGYRGDKVLVYGFDFGFLILQAPLCCSLGLTLEDVGNGTQVNLTLDPGETRTVYALEKINITINTIEGQPVIGPSLPPITTTIDSMQIKIINLQNITNQLARLTIQNPTGENTTSANITITWSGGSETLALDPGEEQWYWAIPGKYTVTITLRKPENYLGELNALSQNTSIILQPGQDKTVITPTLDNLLARLAIINPTTGNSTNAIITIIWNGESETLTLQLGQTAWYWAAPGEYMLNMTLQEPHNFIGNPKALRTSTIIELAVGHQEQQTVPRLDQVLAKLTITNPESTDSIKANLTITWSEGSKTLTLEPGEKASFWAAPANYAILVVYDRPQHFIGPPEALEKDWNITLEPGQNQLETLSTLSSILARIDLSNPNSNIRADIILSWNGEETQLRIDPGENSTCWAAPGAYDLVFRLDAPERFVGSLDALSGGVNVSVRAGEVLDVTVPSLDSLVARILLETDGGVGQVKFIDSGGSVWVVNVSDGSVLWVAPGKYRVVAVYEPPKNYAGVRDSLEFDVGNYTWTRQSTFTLELPGREIVYSSLLSPITIHLLPENATVKGLVAIVNVSVPGSGRTIAGELSPGDSFTVLADPDARLQISIKYLVNGSVVGSEIKQLTPGSGGEVLEFSPPKMGLPGGQPGQTGEPPNANQSPQLEEGTPGARIPPSTHPGLIPGIVESGWNNFPVSMGLIALAVTLGLGGMVLVSRKRKRREHAGVTGKAVSPDDRVQEGEFPEAFRGLFEPLEFVGAGGMGVVWKVRDKRDGRVYALKLPNYRVLERFGLEREEVDRLFLREAVHWEDLGEHPNIVRLYEYSYRPGVYMKLEYIGGVDLGETRARNVRELLKYYRKQGGMVPAELIARIVLDAARGLAYAHSRGLAHLDVKPENLMITGERLEEATVKITDWGIAKLAGSLGVSSIAGLTLSYAAPEVRAPETFKAQGIKPGVWSDIYSLGKVLEELLNLNMPDATGSISPTMPQGSVRSELARLVRRMTAPDPSQRPAAIEIVEHLERLLVET